MTTPLQPGLDTAAHLDADQLSAFAEGMLPEHERTAVLVRSTLPSLRSRTTVSTAQVPAPEQRSRDSEQRSRVSEQPAPAPTAASLADSTAAAQPGLAAPLVTQSRSLALARRNLPLQMQSAAPGQVQAQAKPSPGTQSREGTTDGAASNYLAPASPPAAPQPPHSQPAEAPAIGSSTVNADAFSLEMVDASAIAAHPLPSGLPIATSVSQGKNHLALDTAGTLFRSKHIGKHWRRVKPQWTGPVVKLEVTPDARFQITTAANAIYVSKDGHHWSPSRDD